MGGKGFPIVVTNNSMCAAIIVFLEAGGRGEKVLLYVFGEKSRLFETLG